MRLALHLNHPLAQSPGIPYPPGRKELEWKIRELTREKERKDKFIEEIKQHLACPLCRGVVAHPVSYVTEYVKSKRPHRYAEHCVAISYARNATTVQ